MRRLSARSIGLALFLILATTAASHAQTYGRHQIYGRPPARSQPDQIDISYFYDNLANDGDWFHDPTYGWSWTPYDVSADWRPYSDGHWEYTDYGWSWASNEPWGWATYHYGRWFFDDSYGWAWVPGTEWAPAWVAWRYGDDYVGWAPLPPNAGWDASAGLAFEDAGGIPSQEWCFVPRSHVLDVSIQIQVASVGRNVTLLERSRDATRYEVRGGHPANVGFDVAQLEISLGRRVPRVTIRDVDSPARGGGQSVGGSQVGFFRPMVRPMPVREVPPPPSATRREPISDQVLQQQRDVQQRKLDSDLAAEHAKLARDQDNDLRTQAPGPAADEIRKRHVVEQQAFDAHAAQQRQVMTQRIDRRIVRPSVADGPGKPGNSGNAKGNGKGNGRGHGKDDGKDNGKDNGKGHGKGDN